MIDREVALIIGPFRLVQQPDPTSWVVTENGAPIGMVHWSSRPPRASFVTTAFSCRVAEILAPSTMRGFDDRWNKR
jgi:hypothetical protein